MKKKLLTILAAGVLMLPGVAFAVGPHDVRMVQRDEENTVDLQRDLVLPSGGSDWGVIGWDADEDELRFLLINEINTQADWTESDTARSTFIKNKPEFPDVVYSGDYTDLVNAPELATVATSGSYNDLSDKPAARSQSSASRALNTCYQVDASRDSLVNYSVDVGATMTLTSGETGSVFLEIYSDSGCTTGTQELTRFVNGNSGTLTLGLNLTQTVTGTVTGYVPAGSYVKIRTANTVGSPSFTYRSGQEVLF